ncbi:hypothetical protein EHS25_002232 [Saitozyma podzolica]|uniref:Major facilitator superfamily (MFS) profile domain-containing protein n=1 Tax=Saitozyma podzolica TaxID=1890683 RepID=A0A427YET8_9TREE|nr:hypothetical protein EHS25_002232 [Saitozyma podzolica]
MAFVDHRDRDDKSANGDQAPQSISPHQDVVIIDDLEDDEVHEMAASVTALPFRRGSSRRRSSRTARSPYLPETNPVEDTIGEKPPSPHSPPPPTDFLSTRRSSSSRKTNVAPLSTDGDRMRTLPHLAFDSVEPPSRTRGESARRTFFKRRHGQTISQRHVSGSRQPPESARLTMMIGTLWFVLFMGGWNDGSTGPLIPRLQDHYNVDFGIISLVWIVNFAGCLTSSVIVGPLTERFGFSYVSLCPRVELGGQLPSDGMLIPCRYAAPGCASKHAPLEYWLVLRRSPFSASVTLSAASGMRYMIKVSQVNSLLARLPEPRTKLSCGHALYGAGAAISPLVATEFATYVPKITYYYLVSLGIALLLGLIILLVFRGRRAEEIIPLDHQRLMEELEVRRALTTASTSATVSRRPSFDESNPGATGIDSSIQLQTVSDLERRGSITQPPQIPLPLPESTGGQSFFDIIRYRPVQLMAVYLFIYVGVEVGIGGWIVTFIINERQGPTSSGYISSGYFAGRSCDLQTKLTRLRSCCWPLGPDPSDVPGRTIPQLLKLTPQINNNRAVYLYTSVCIVSEIVVWTVQNIYANGFAVALCGFFLGPIYPISMATISACLPKRIQTPSIAFVSSIGAGGSAVVPFITGLLAQAFNISVLQPVVIILLACSVVTWFFIARLGSGQL